MEEQKFELLKKKHKNYNMRGIYNVIISFIISIISVFVINCFAKDLLISIVVSLVIGIFVLAILVFKTQSNDFFEIEDEYKEYFVKPLINSKIKNCKYDMSRGIDEEEIKKHDLINGTASYKTIDLIDGIYNNIHFLESDLVIEKDYTDSTNATVHYFIGQWFIIFSEKKLDFNLRIIEKDSINYKENASLKLINTSNEKFNDRFYVYTDDMQLANEFLSDKLMNKILDLHLKQKMILIYDNGKLHIGINNVNKQNHGYVLKSNKTFYFIGRKLKTYEEEKQNILLKIKEITDVVEIFNFD